MVLFATNCYELSSISELVRRLKLSKGSFYRYFESKRDLYDYLIELASQKKLHFTAELLDAPVTDFFMWFESLHYHSLLFDLSHPREACLLYNAGRERFSNELGDVMLSNKKLAIKHYKKLLRATHPDLPRGFNRTAVAYQFMQAGMGMIDLVEIKFKVSLMEAAVKGTPINSISSEKLEQFIEQIVHPLRNLLHKKSPETSLLPDFSKSL